MTVRNHGYTYLYSRQGNAVSWKYYVRGSTRVAEVLSPKARRWMVRFIDFANVMTGPGTGMVYFAAR